MSSHASSFTGHTLQVALTEYQTASFFAAEIAAWASISSAFAATASAVAAGIAAWGIWRFGKAMERSSETRAAQAAEDRKVTQVTLAALEELLRRTSPRPGPSE